MTLTGKIANVSLETITPEACYLTKSNIAFPGNQTQATAAEATVAPRLNDLESPSTVAVTAGSIQVAP